MLTKCNSALKRRLHKTLGAIKMKRIITILTLIFMTAIGFAQTDSIRGNQFELKGKIINEISLTPHCGTIAWGNSY